MVTVEHAAVMPHQVDLQEGWLLVIPLGERPHRDLMLQQGAGPRMTSAFS